MATIPQPHANYVLRRLLDDRRITTRDITIYLDQLNHEITQLTERLVYLRSIAPNTPPRRRGRPPRTAHNTSTATHPIASNAPPSTPSRPVQHRKRRTSPALRAQRQLQGRYLGYMRHLTTAEKAHFHAIKERDGFHAAIAALRNHLGK